MQELIEKKHFESLWSTIRSEYHSGSFEYVTPTKPFKTVVTSHFRSVRERNRYGVYIIRQKSTMDVLYVGKGGTIKPNGEFKDQDLPGRLKAERAKLNSNQWFGNLCNEYGPLVIEYIFLSAKPESPALVEAKLIQVYLNEFGKLPDKLQAF